jgi:hypothetical protein
MFVLVHKIRFSRLFGLRIYSETLNRFRHLVEFLQRKIGLSQNIYVHKKRNNGIHLGLYRELHSNPRSRVLERFTMLSLIVCVACNMFNYTCRI